MRRLLLVWLILALCCLPGAAWSGAAQPPAPSDATPPETSSAAGKQPASAAPHLIVLRDLIEQRLALMPDVARYKWHQASPIEDVPREQKIIEGLQQQALALGIPATCAESFFRAQIEAAKQIQREHFSHWQQAGAAPVAAAPDLALVTRPKLDALTPQLLQALAQVWPTLANVQQQVANAQALQSPNKANPSPQGSAMALAPLQPGGACAVAATQAGAVTQPAK
jgi:chorismate mutase-like protein